MATPTAGGGMRPLPTMSLQELYEQGRRSTIQSATTTTTTSLLPQQQQQQQQQPAAGFALPTSTFSSSRGAPPAAPAQPAAAVSNNSNSAAGFATTSRAGSATPLTDQLRATFANLGMKPPSAATSVAAISSSGLRSGSVGGGIAAHSTVPRLTYGATEGSLPRGGVGYNNFGGSSRGGLAGLVLSPRGGLTGSSLPGPLFSGATGFVRGLSSASSLPVMTHRGGSTVPAVNLRRALGDIDDDVPEGDDGDSDAFGDDYDDAQGRALLRPGADQSGGADVDYSEGETKGEDDEDDEGALPLPPFPNDEVPVVPPQHLARIVRPIQWARHPSAPIVLALLSKRGVQLPQHKDVVEYHMAEAFLDSLGYLRHGAYFVKYAQKHAAPKERFLVVQMQDDQFMRPTPYLVWYIHQNGVQAVDKVALDMLVGVSVGHQHSHAFRRHLVSHDIIKGCFCGNHKARFPTNGCFTLWFYDRKSRTPRSVDLLTTNHEIFDLWVTTMKGVLSVNSVSLTGRADGAAAGGGGGGVGAAEVEHYMSLAQQQLAEGDDDVVNHMEGFMDH